MMNKGLIRCCKLSLIILLLLLGISPLKAEEEKAADVEKPVSAIPWFTLDMLENPFLNEPNYLDTTHTEFQLYDFFSPRNPFFANKGNVGHVSRLLQFGEGKTNEFQLFRADPYQQYRLLQEHTVYYRPAHVFSDLFYVTGANREQLFYGMHTQRLQERLVASVNYRLVNSPGSYSRMASRNTNVFFGIDYKDEQDRYQLLANFIVNRFENQQSGGLKNYLGFEENPVRDSVFLYSASSRYRETAVHLNHFYRTGFFTSPSDLPSAEGLEAAVDSTRIAERQFTSLGRINHHFFYQRRSYVFDERTRPYAFYDFPPANNAVTLDSTQVNTITNQISWSNFPMERENSTFPFNFRLSLTHRFVDIRQPLFVASENTDNTNDPAPYLMKGHSFNQLVPGIAISSDRRRLFSFDGYSNMVIGGYNDEDFDLGGNIYFGGIRDAFRLEAGVDFSQKEAAYLFSHFRGNYIQWENSFEKQNQMRISGKIHHRKLSLFVNYFLLNNMVFMNNHAIPVQNTKTFSLISSGASTTLGIGVLQSRHHLLFQYTSTDQFERFPVFSGYHSVYGDFSMFNKALYMQVGLDVLLNTPYKPMGYLPVVWQFYAQDTYEADFTILADVFITAKIKRTRFFLKLQNLAGLLINSPPVYSIPFYPQPEMGFKFGLSWMFFD